MIKDNDIKDIIKSVKPKWRNVSMKDIAFCILHEAFDDKEDIYKLIYGAEPLEGVAAYCNSDKVQMLIDALKPYTLSNDNADETITRSENRAGLIRQLKKLQSLIARKKISEGEAFKRETEIRCKLEKEFDLEEGDGQKHIIIVPQKHDYICPHTNRECSKMPSKKACMEYYNLTEKEVEQER